MTSAAARFEELESSTNPVEQLVAELFHDIASRKWFEVAIDESEDREKRTLLDEWLIKANRVLGL